MRLVLLTALGLSQAAFASVTLESLISEIKPESHSTATLDSAANRELFLRYCEGDPSDSTVPRPKYSHPLVQTAALKLSQTKDLADELLKNQSYTEYENQIRSSKESVEALSHLSYAKIANAAKLLKSAIDKASTAGYSAETRELLTSFEAALIESIADALTRAIPVMQAELKAMDRELVLKNAKDLRAKVVALIPAADLKAILKASEDVIEKLNDSQVQLDRTKLADYLQLVKKDFEPYKESYYLHEMFSTIEQIQANLNAASLDEPALAEELTELNSSLEWLLNPEEGLKISSELKAQESIFRTQLAIAQKSTMKDFILRFIGSVQIAIEDSAQIGKVADMLWQLEQYTAIIDQSNWTALKNAVAILEKLNTPFETQNIISSVDSFIQATEQNYSDLGYYFDSAKSFINAHDSYLNTPEVKSLVSSIESELVKGEGQAHLNALLSAQEDLKELKAPLTESTYYTFHSLNYVLADNLQKIGPPLRPLFNEIVDLTKAFEHVSVIGTNLAAVPPASVQSQHFYFYGGVTRLYGLNKAHVPSDAPTGTRPVAHIFLTQLCGEYRDRSTMIEAKLNWISNLFILPKNESKTFQVDLKKNVWSQIPANAYDRYLSLSHDVWSAKQATLSGSTQIGQYSHIDRTVDGATVCETKFMLSEYVGKDRPFEDYKTYLNDYQSFQAKCTSDDLDHYYDFRGDSNFKHYSPESNGMIWYATSLAKGCKSHNKAQAGQTVFTDKDCEEYFKNPFFYRYNAARAGLMTWLFRDEKHRDTFGSQGQMVAIYPHRLPSYAPFSFGFSHETAEGELFDFMPEWLALGKLWHQPDMGINELFGLGKEDVKVENLERVYTLLRDAVDRHTDWYSSGYNDKNGTAKNQAYSPFVASSYEMSESNSFTQCGITVQCPDDGLKRWMFVFKVHKDNWYTPERLARGEPIDFNRMWFDETAFGDSNLANSEKAWDRLGSPNEPELDSILYLINVNATDAEH